ncbi:MAG: hypothetical protein ACI9UR_002575 [Bacteroidia bacterium]|jgi:hypothetical protein
MLNQFPKFFTGVENREEHLLKIGYSAFYFAFTFILLHYIGHAWSTANAWDFGYRPLFSYDRMDSLATTDNWTVARVGWVYLASPLFGLAVSIASVVLFRTVDGTRTHLKTILYWFGVNGFMLYFSYLITGLLSGQDYGSTMYTGFASYYGWLEWESGKIYGILTVQILLSLPYAVLFSKPVLQLNYSRLLASKQNGKSLVFINVVLLPFLIGIALIVLTTFPLDARYQIVRLFCYFPLFLVMYLGVGFYRAKHISIVKRGLKPVPMMGLIVLIILLLVSRVGLSLPIEPFW